MTIAAIQTHFFRYARATTADRGYLLREEHGKGYLSPLSSDDLLVTFDNFVLVIEDIEELLQGFEVLVTQGVYLHGLKIDS